MKNTRTENAMRNVSTAVVGQIFNIVLNFICRTIFIYALGKEYLGVSGLFSNILTIMSLAELGIGDAIVYKMYKPVADKDYERIKMYMQFYKKAYWIIGTVVFGAGLVLIPFLQYLISGGEGIEHIKFIYFLYLFNTASTYFFSYKKLIINTDQKGYIDTINRYLFLILQNIVQIIVLLLWKDFVIYLLVQINANLIANIRISKVATKMYPFINEKAQKLPEKDKHEIFKQTMALVMHKLGGVCVSGTDNLLLSAFVGIGWVGIYSNYVTNLGIPQTLLAYIFSPLTASIGNLINTENTNHLKKTFDKLLFVNFWMYGFSSICLFVLLNSFIGKVWIDESYLLGLPIVFFIVLNFYITGMRQVISAFKSSAGLFWNDRFRPIAEAAVNLVASLILLKFTGFIGVIIGTTISALTTTFWVEAEIVYKHVLDEKPYKFFIVYTKYLASTIAGGILCCAICNLIEVNGLLTFILQLIICVTVSNLFFVLLYFRTTKFKELWHQFFASIIKRRFSLR